MATVRVLARELAFPGMQDHVAPLEVVDARRLRRPLPELAALVRHPATANDRPGSAEDEVLVEAVLVVAVVQAA